MIRLIQKTKYRKTVRNKDVQYCYAKLTAFPCKLQLKNKFKKKTPF